MQLWGQPEDPGPSRTSIHAMIDEPSATTALTRQTLEKPNVRGHQFDSPAAARGPDERLAHRGALGGVGRVRASYLMVSVARDDA